MEDIRIEEEYVGGQPTTSTKEIEVSRLSDSRLAQEKPNLDGVTVTITDVALIPKEEELETKDGDFVYRPVLLRVSYNNGVVEFVSGLRQFRHGGQWGEPTFFTGGRSGVADLFRTWTAKTGTAPADVSLKQFLQSLVGMKCQIRVTTVVYQGKEFIKNLPGKFL